MKLAPLANSISRDMCVNVLVDVVYEYNLDPWRTSMCSLACAVNATVS